MELRRYKDILALKSEDGALLAFHSRNMEVAQISEETWNHMSPTSLLESRPLDQVLQESDAIEELKCWNQENNEDAKTSKISNDIRYLTLNVTQICNLHCTYCAAGGDGSFGDTIARISIEKTLPQLKFFLDRLPPKVSFNVSFLGGEPLLYAEGIELVANYIAQAAPGREVHYTIITNGTLLSAKNIELLARLKATVTISLDGPPEINDRMRPTKNKSSSTDLVVAGLERLLKRKFELTMVMIHGVFDSNNMELAQAYDFYSRFAVDGYDFSFSVSDTNPRATQKYMQQMSLIASRAYAQGGERALRKIRAFDQHFESLDQQLRTENYCGAGKSFLMIDARNQIFTCPWDVNDKREQVGEETSLNEAALQRYQQPLIEQNNCGTCWARFLCGGGCLFAHKHASGDKNIKNTQFCERTRFTAALALVYYERCRNSA